MVTTAVHDGQNWQRASYLELDQTREPQAIGTLLPHVLARYAALAEPAVAREERHFEEDEEDMHTLAASTAM